MVSLFTDPEDWRNAAPIGGGPYQGGGGGLAPGFFQPGSPQFAGQPGTPQYGTPQYGTPPGGIRYAQPMPPGGIRYAQPMPPGGVSYPQPMPGGGMVAPPRMGPPQINIPPPGGIRNTQPMPSGPPPGGYVQPGNPEFLQPGMADPSIYTFPEQAQHDFMEEQARDEAAQAQDKIDNPQFYPKSYNTKGNTFGENVADWFGDIKAGFDREGGLGEAWDFVKAGGMPGAAMRDLGLIPQDMARTDPNLQTPEDQTVYMPPQAPMLGNLQQAERAAAANPAYRQGVAPGTQTAMDYGLVPTILAPEGPPPPPTLVGGWMPQAPMVDPEIANQAQRAAALQAEENARNTRIQQQEYDALMEAEAAADEMDRAMAEAQSIEDAMQSYYQSTGQVGF